MGRRLRCSLPVLQCKLIRTIAGWINLGDGVFWYLLTLALLLNNPEAALAAVLHMLIVGLICTALYKLIKGKTLRPRPFNVYPGIICASRPLDQFSFPSGHTLHAVAFSIIAVAYFPGLIWLAC